MLGTSRCLGAGRDRRLRARRCRSAPPRAGDSFYASPTGKAAVSASKVGRPVELDDAVAKAGTATRSCSAGEYTALIHRPHDRRRNRLRRPGRANRRSSKRRRIAERPRQLAKSNAALHDLRLEGEGSARTRIGHRGKGLRRLRRRANRRHDSSAACIAERHDLSADSVCWTSGNRRRNGRHIGRAQHQPRRKGQDKPVVLRNVTAIADNEEGNAIFACSARRTPSSRSTPPT